VSIYNPFWSPDGSQIAYTGGAVLIPHDSSPSYSGEKLVYRNPEYIAGQLFAVSSSGGGVVPLGTKGDYDAAGWIDSTRIVFARQSNQFKTRTTVGIQHADFAVEPYRLCVYVFR